MTDKRIYVAMAMGIPPWGLITIPLGVIVQVVAVSIQIIGLALLIILYEIKLNKYKYHGLSNNHTTSTDGILFHDIR